MSSMSYSVFHDLVEEFPPLWDPRDLHFRDRKVRDRCLRLLQDKCNRVSTIPITREWVKKKLKLMYCRRYRYEKSKGHSGNTPAILDSQAHQRLCSLRSSTYSGISIAGHVEGHSGNTPATLDSQAHQRLCSLRSSTYSGISIAGHVEENSTSAVENPATASTPKKDLDKGTYRLEELLADYPCLWDPRDLNFRDATLKNLCREKLLLKYNSLSSIAINMQQLKKKLETLRCRLNKRKLRDLMAEYPCLWDTQDLNYTNAAMKSQSWEHLLVKYNSVSSIQINMEQLKKRMNSMKPRLCERRKKAAMQLSSSEDSMDEWLSDHATSSDSVEPVNEIQNVTQKNPNQQTGLFTIVFHCCGVCGEVASDCLKVTDQSYVVNNKTTITMNDTILELNFGKDVTVCQKCDAKLKEMHDFVKLVKSAQDKINNVNIVDETDELTVDEEQKFIIDAITVTDTELINTTVNKRKNEENPEMRKKFRVTIDLNSNDNIDNDRRTMDDIEAKYQMFRKEDLLAKSKESDVSKVIVTEDSEDVVLVKREIDDDIHNEVDKTEELLTTGDIENKYQMFKIKDAATLSKSKDADKSNAVLENDVQTVDETEQIVTSGKRNDVVNEHTLNSVKTNETASVANDVASNVEPMCVMPKSELILLVESIVSRMMNK